MMGPLSRTVLISLASLGALSVPASLAAEESPLAAETARRQVDMRDAMQELQEARLAYSARRYSEAVEHYREALALLPKAPSTQKQQQFIKDSLSDALIAKAIDYRSVGRSEEAVAFLKEAAELSPDNQRARVELAHTQDAVRTNPAMSPQHAVDVAEVSRLLELAYGQMDLGRYDEAIATFHEVRKYDAYNTAAMRGIEQAHKRRASYFRTAHDSYRAQAIAKVDSLWEESTYDTSLPPELAGSGSSEVLGALDSELESSFADALSRMVMPQIVFEEASVSEVIETLQNQIRRFEAEGITASRHINIHGNFGAQNSAGYQEIMGKKVSLNLSQVSVRDVLELLVSQLDLSYYYTPLGVELSYSGRDFGPLVERSFTVPPHFFDGAGDAADEEDDEESGFSDSSSSITVRRVNPVQSLKSMGISFPEGATARYTASTRTLHVRNTTHNLEDIEELLNVPLSEERQVVLNVVMMQVSEQRLEELGFDWLVKLRLGHDFYGGGGVSQDVAGAAGLPSIRTQITEEGDYMTSGLRSGSQAINQPGMETLIENGSPAAFGQGQGSKAPGIFSLRGVWTAADVAFIMRGLNQKKGVDILQNPQIVFSPGEEEQVTFANVRELYYPEDYEEPEVVSTTHVERDGDDNISENDVENVTVTSFGKGAHPSSFARFAMSDEGVGGIGTILQVHSAELKENGRFIDLALTTQINDFEGFINWGSPLRSKLIRFIGSGSEVVPAISAGAVEIEFTPNYILKPIFKRQLVNTAVTVAPGSVLVFAGLNDMKTIRYEDKVPVLGDLPLVGRFFRSSGEQNTRKVLLYFAKVDVVDPAGRDVRTGQRPGGLMEGL